MQLILIVASAAFAEKRKLRTHHTEVFIITLKMIVSTFVILFPYILRNASISKIIIENKA